MQFPYERLTPLHEITLGQKRGLDCLDFINIVLVSILSGLARDLITVVFTTTSMCLKCSECMYNTQNSTC